MEIRNVEFSMFQNEKYGTRTSMCTENTLVMTTVVKRKKMNKKKNTSILISFCSFITQQFKQQNGKEKYSC